MPRASPIQILVSARSLQSSQALTRPRVVRDSKTGPPRAPLDANPTSSKISVWKSRQFHTKDSSRAAVRTFRASERWFPGKSASAITNMASKKGDSERQGRRTDHACSNLHRPSHPFEPQTLLQCPGGRRLDPNQTLQRRTTRIRVERTHVCPNLTPFPQVSGPFHAHTTASTGPHIMN